MPVAPAASCALVVVERTRVTTSTPESPDVPARNGFNGFLRALPGDRALLPPSPCGLKVLSSPVEPNEPPQDLTPASRRQDHTTSPSASSAVVLHAANRSRRAIRPALASHAQHCRVHRTPPRVRDDHDTPLWWGGMARVLDLIWVRWQQIFFGKSEKKTRQPRRQTARRANHRRPAQRFPSRLLQELRAQHQALDLVGTAFDFVGVVGEVNASDHGAVLQHSGGAARKAAVLP
jgi:hypothetical protein